MSIAPLECPAQSRHATAINRYECETALGGETRDSPFLYLVQEDEAYIVTRGGIRLYGRILDAVFLSKQDR